MATNRSGKTSAATVKAARGTKPVKPTKSTKAAKATKPTKTIQRRKQRVAGAEKQIPLLTPKALVPVQVVALMMQRVALHGVAPQALGKLGDGLDQLLAIQTVLSTLMQEHALTVYLEKGWDGKMKDDYLFTEADFPALREAIVQRLLPAYRFSPGPEFDQKYSNGTLGDLAIGVDEATTTA